MVCQSIVTVGAAAGGLLGGWMVEKIGRKLSLMFCSLPFVFGFTIIIAAQNVWMLYLGRVLTGLASGVTSLVVPVRSNFPASKPVYHCVAFSSSFVDVHTVMSKDYFLGVITLKLSSIKSVFCEMNDFTAETISQMID